MRDSDSRDDGPSGRTVYKIIATVLLILATTITSCVGCSNPETRAGYMGYVTRGAWVGKTRFYGVQRGPVSTGLGWLLKVVNVSITPYTYHEDFSDQETVLSHDNLPVKFRVHVTWHIRADRVRQFVERYSTLQPGDERTPDSVAQTAYNNYLREPIRTFARDEVQQYDALAIKDHITGMGEALLRRAKEFAANKPFAVTAVVVGNIQLPQEVVTATARKIAATQELERQGTQILIANRQAEQRREEARGIADAMDIINKRLTLIYLQHEAIEAQRAMVGSPNHTTIYIPVGPMGVPIVRTQ